MKDRSSIGKKRKYYIKEKITAPNKKDTIVFAPETLAAVKKVFVDPNTGKQKRLEEGPPVMTYHEYVLKIVTQPRPKNCFVFADIGEVTNLTPPTVPVGSPEYPREIINFNKYSKLPEYTKLVYEDTGEEAPQYSIKGQTYNGRKIISNHEYGKQVVHLHNGENAIKSDNGKPLRRNVKSIVYRYEYEMYMQKMYQGMLKFKLDRKQHKEFEEGLLSLQNEKKDELMSFDLEPDRNLDTDLNLDLDLVDTQSRKKSKIEEIETKQIDTKTIPQVVRPSFFIGDKYLLVGDEKKTQLPFASSSQPKQKIMFESVVAFKQVRHFSKEKDRKLEKIPIRYLGIGATVEFSLMSTQGPLHMSEAVTFICAGRGLDAFVPGPAKGSRVVLIMPSSQYESLKNKISPSLDVLVCEKLESSSHGIFENTGSITERRLFAYHAALQFGLNDFVMLDDNITQVKAQSTTLHPTDPWLNYYRALKRKNFEKNSVSVSVQTESTQPKLYEYDPLVLGCKLFMINMDLLRNKFSTPEHIFALLPPGNKWGEDYFMQLMFFEAFHQLNYAGNYRLPDAEFCLVRSNKNRNVCVRTLSTKKAHVYLEENILEQIKVENLDPEFFAMICNVLDHMSDMVRANIKNYEKGENRKASTDLVATHALIEKAKMQDLKQEISEKPLAPEELLALYKEKLPKLLRKHQLDALHAILGCQLDEALIQISTGGGKTRIGIMLLIYYHLFLRDDKSPLVVVTPTIDLVKQYYADFMDIINLLQKQNIPTIPAKNIVKVSSDSKDVQQELLAHDSLQEKNLVYIICKNSFMKLMTGDERILNPAVLLLDESHLFTKGELEIIRQYQKNQFKIFAFTATPKEEDMERIYHYSRKNAMDDGVLTPLILDKFTEDYSKANAKLLLKNLPTLLSQHLHPSGFSLSQLKGAIYCPPGTDLDMLKIDLEMKGITSIVIHSKEKNIDAIVQLFKKTTTPVVALLIRMLTLGYDDAGMEYVLTIQDPDSNRMQQMCGRSVRTKTNYASKIAYALTFNNAKTQELELGPKNADDIGIALASRTYLQQRKERPSINDYSPLPDMKHSMSTTKLVDTLMLVNPEIKLEATSVSVTPEDKTNYKMFASASDRGITQLSDINRKKLELLSQLKKLEMWLREIRNPEKDALRLPASIPQPTGPWTGQERAATLHHLKIYELEAQRIKAELAKMGESCEELYRHGFPSEGLKY